MELHSSTHEVIGVILPETTQSNLALDDRSIDIRISSLAGMMTMTTGTALPEARREEPGRTLGAIHVLLLVRDEIRSQVDTISPRCLVHLIIRYSDDPTASGFVPYEQRFPRTIDQSGSHAVRFITTEESVNALSDLSALN